MIQIKLNKYLDLLGQNTVINCSQNGALYKLSTLIDKIWNVFVSDSWTCQSEDQKPSHLKRSYSKYNNFLDVLLLDLDNEYDVSIDRSFFSKEGVEGEVLDTNSGNWIQGKVRAKIIFELEFIPN